ncbi:Vesicle transport protein [Aphelenchoides besseyi]|nr:Vesicle transport protein [Aphelenchoides besseyi]KAI6192727.1 Vesicle transport protein [Aphelenchoides besseyi]
MFDRFRRSVPADLETQSTQGIIEEDTTQLSGLSYETRLYCFAGCLILSILTSVLGSPFMFVGKFAEFAVLTSLGAIISIGGTFFLTGPKKQLLSMFEPRRLIATLLYLLMIVLTLMAGLVWRNPILAIVCVVVQYVCMVYYSLSFIPYANQLLTRLLGRCC